MYDLVGYGHMIDDRQRMDAHVAALERLLRPGAAVLDLGAGAGIFSMLAAKMGAGVVHAIELNEPALRLARRFARENDVENHIRFYAARSENVSLAPPADLMIFDLRSVLPLFGSAIPTVIDARRRLLAPAATLIPRRDVLRAALVESPANYRPFASPWLDEPRGLNLRSGRETLINRWRKAGSAAPVRCLSAPQTWAEIDYATVESPHLGGGAEWEIAEPGEAHGALVWFDAEMAPGVVMSGAPGNPELIYGRAFFPFPNPVRVAPGDRATIRFEARLIGGGYTWMWTTRIAGHAANPSAEPLAEFRQCTFFADEITTADLRAREPESVFRLSEDGEIDLEVLAAMRAGRRLGEAAETLAARWPARFATPEEALARVGAVAKTHGEPAGR